MTSELKWLAALLFIALLSGCAARQAHLPPVESLSGYGCAVAHVEGAYRLTGWAWHGNKEEEKFCGPGKDWCIELSRDSSLDRTLKACLEWYHAVEKKTKTKPKGQK